jgi:20S proteasome subunit alpha 6
VFFLLLSFSLASLEDLIRHGLHALRETLQQDKELNVNNTSIGLIGPSSEHEKKDVQPEGAFRILENEAIEPFLQTMVAKEDASAASASSSGPTASASGDVQMSG